MDVHFQYPNEIYQDSGEPLFVAATSIGIEVAVGKPLVSADDVEPLYLLTVCYSDPVVSAAASILVQKHRQTTQPS